MGKNVDLFVGLWNDAKSSLVQALTDLENDAKDWPDSGEIETDLAKEKTEKDFDKKKKKWQGKLDASKKLREKTSDAFAVFSIAIYNSEAALENWDKEKTATDKAIRDVIKAIDKINSWLTELGFDPVKKPEVDSWSKVLSMNLEASKQIEEEKKLYAMWRRQFDDVWDKPLDKLLKELKEAKFKGVKGKGPATAGKRR
jgi:hypothetical protein